MKRFKFLFNNVEVSNPVGWDKMIESMNRDKSLKGIFLTHETPLEFIGDAYTHLYNMRDVGYCSRTEIRILESCNRDGYYEDVYSGILETSDCEFTLNKCIAKVKINDNTFYAKINNNKSLECYLTASKSKNGLAITPIALQNVTYTDPTNGGLYTTMPNTIMRVYDVLKYLIAFMTDNEVDFDSTLFKTGGDYDGLALTTGFGIANSGIVNNPLTATEFKDMIPVIKYVELFQELDRKLNLGFYFDLSGGRPKIYIERYEDTKVPTTVINISKIKEIKASYYVDKLYSAVKLGSDRLDQFGSFAEDIRIKGFKTEEYPILGKCNLDNVLDLTTNYICSSNIIENLVNNTPADNTYDSDWFLIDCNWNQIDELQPKTSNWITQNALPVFYNERLSNENVLVNYLGSIPSTIAVQLGIVDNTFSAEIPSNMYAPTFASVVTYEPVQLNIETYDPNNRFNIVTHEYTATNGGVYSFATNLGVIPQNVLNPNGQAHVDVYAELQVWSGGGYGVGTLTQIITVLNYLMGSGSTVTSGVQLTFNPNIVNVNLQAGDKVILMVRLVSAFVSTPFGPTGTISRLSRAVLTCTASADGGGTYKTFDPEDCPLEKYSFTKQISRYDYNYLKRNILKAITFDDGKRFYKGWVDSLKYNLTTSEAKWVIMSKGKRPRMRCGLYVNEQFPGSPYYDNYGRINRRYLLSSYHKYTILSMVINGVNYANGNSLAFPTTSLVMGIGLDGNLYAQNLSDFVNSLLPQGWQAYDDMMAIEFPVGGTYEIKIKYEDIGNGINYGVYTYNNTGFFLPDHVGGSLQGNLQAVYQCQLV